MPFIHLAEIHQGFTGNKLVGVGQAGSCSGNTPRLHLQELVTGANMYRDFTVLRAFLHILPTYILRMIRNTKSDCGSIEHLGKTFFLGAVGGGPIVRHLAKKTRRVRVFKINLISTRSYGPWIASGISLCPAHTGIPDALEHKPTPTVELTRHHPYSRSPNQSSHPFIRHRNSQWD
jgi:hypothetical protein